MLMKTVLASMVLLFAASANGGDIAAGKAKSGLCAGCHGSAGISGNDLWPNLAGQKVGYLKNQLKLFRSGKRSDPMMAGISKSLSDQDIDNLASYYASLK
ncbi:c-type cytochrome [Kistimonas asteriae]|uniref:c-type cytochrome n=1 Tax=Kistimonas asteriae TaxID=517724 RepID=UPI001FE9B8C4|nr:cytochrome c [Kistimonas asteriae]